MSIIGTPIIIGGGKDKGVKPYLTFSSPSEFTLATGTATKTWDGKLYYSTDTATWTEWDGTTTLSSANGKLYLLGTNNTIISGLSGSSSLPSSSLFAIQGTNVSCEGNIESLLNAVSVIVGEHPTMGDYAFGYLFYNQSALISCPDLPSPVLSTGCYEGMCRGTSIRTLPELPAQTLAERCYIEMARQCEYLTHAPDIPALTLPRFACTNMYFGCISLLDSPSIKATTVADSACLRMFSECTSIKSISSLYAANIPSFSFSTMYNNCPLIKISESQSEEYPNPYRIPISGQGVGSSLSAQNMFTGTGGTFTGTPTVNTTYYTANEIIA